MLDETPDERVCMQISEYTTDEIWMKAQIYATEFTITIFFLSLKWMAAKINKTQKTDLTPDWNSLGLEINLSDCAFITTKKIQRQDVHYL